MDRWERFKKGYVQASNASTLLFFLMFGFIIVVSILEAVYPPLVKHLVCVGFLFFFTFISTIHMDFFNGIFRR